VVYVDHVARLSGGEIALMRLIDALDEVDAHVILAEDGPLVARLSAAGVSVEVLPMRERTRDLRKDRVRPAGLPITALLDTATYVFRLARRLRAIQPDLVHTNSLKAGIYGSLAARLKPTAPSPHRGLPPARDCPRSRLRAATHDRRQNQARDPPRTQTPHRPRGLQHAP
jgi:hypothetical protein